MATTNLLQGKKKRTEDNTLICEAHSEKNTAVMCASTAAGINLNYLYTHSFIQTLHCAASSY